MLYYICRKAASKGGISVRPGIRRFPFIRPEALALCVALLLGGCSLFSGKGAPSYPPSSSSSAPAPSSSSQAASSGTISSAAPNALLTRAQFVQEWMRQKGKCGADTAPEQALALAAQSGEIPAGIDGSKALTVQEAAYLLTAEHRSAGLDFTHYDWQISDLSAADAGLQKYLIDAYAQGLIGTRNGCIEPHREVTRSAADTILARAANTSRALPPDRAAPYFAYHGLVEVKRIDPSVVLDLKYATKDNFTGVVHYKTALCLLQADTAKALARADQAFRKRGYTIKIWDAYRPVAVQWELYRDTPANLKQYAPAPSKNSQHSKGIAADVTLVDRSGRELAMPTGFDSFSEKAHADYPDLPADVLQNRALLRAGMEKQGFAVYSYEWWHFYLPSETGLSISDVSFEAFIAARDAFYQSALKRMESGG